MKTGLCVLTNEFARMVVKIHSAPTGIQFDSCVAAIADFKPVHFLRVNVQEERTTYAIASWTNSA